MAKSVDPDVGDGTGVGLHCPDLSVQTLRILAVNGPDHAKTCLMHYANNKGADQPAHPRSLISTFVVRCLDSMICILAISRVSRFYLASVAEQAGLNFTWSKIPEDMFSRDVAQMIPTALNWYSDS